MGLGDLLTAVPALRALAEAFPGHRRLLAAPAALAPLAAVIGAVTAVVPTDLRRGEEPAPLVALPARLRGADMAVNLHGRGPQSHRILLATAPRRLLAFAHPQVARLGWAPQWADSEHEVQRWCRLLTAHGIRADPTHLDLSVPAEPAARGATVIHPGAASPARRWPADRWAAVARSEAATGRRVVVTGSADEVALARRVAEDAGLAGDAVLAGRTDVLGLARVVAAAARVVCGDTGVAHLATAVATPSVVLFGPTSPARWGPPPDRPWHRALWAGSDGRASHPHPHAPHPSRHPPAPPSPHSDPHPPAAPTAPPSPHAARPDARLLQISVADVIEALALLPAPLRSGGSRTRQR